MRRVKNSFSAIGLKQMQIERELQYHGANHNMFSVRYIIADRFENLHKTWNNAKENQLLSRNIFFSCTKLIFRIYKRKTQKTISELWDWIAKDLRVSATMSRKHERRKLNWIVHKSNGDNFGGKKSLTLYFICGAINKIQFSFWNANATHLRILFSFIFHRLTRLPMHSIYGLKIETLRNKKFLRLRVDCR